jgi:hypothetical protein
MDGDIVWELAMDSPLGTVECDHEYIEDWVDLDPERSQHIVYCRWCEMSPSPKIEISGYITTGPISSSCPPNYGPPNPNAQAISRVASASPTTPPRPSSPLSSGESLHPPPLRPLLPLPRSLPDPRATTVPGPPMSIPIPVVSVMRR